MAFFDRTFLILLFCQTLIFVNVLSKMWFCQNRADNVLSKFVEFLSNTGGYIDSVLFCQSPQSCLTELFVCLTEFRLGLTELPKNVKIQIFYQKHLVLINILKNPRDKIHEMLFKELCQEDLKPNLSKKIFSKNFMKINNFPKINFLIFFSIVKQFAISCHIWVDAV